RSGSWCPTKRRSATARRSRRRASRPSPDTGRTGSRFRGQALQQPAGGDHAEGGGDVGGGAVAGVATKPGGQVFGTLVAHAAVAGGEERGFVGPHRLDAELLRLFPRAGFREAVLV